MLKERLREMIFGAAPAPAALDRDSGRAFLSFDDGEPTGRERHSHGLDQFFGVMRGQPGQPILDLGEINQNNVSFITDLGYKLYSEDFLRELDLFYGSGPGAIAGHSDARRASGFLDHALGYAPNQFGGVVVWDALQCLAKPLLGRVVERLHQVLRPHGCLLALFHTDEKASTMPVYSYRIGGPRTLMFSPKGDRRAAQAFNNRGIERLFQDFASVKFFLTRDRLREVIVRR